MTHKRNVSGFLEHNEELHDATIEAIEQSFRLLMEETPYEKITVSQIVRKAGVSRSAFYRNYETKDELFDKIIMRVMGKVTDMIFENLTFKKYWSSFFKIVYDNKESFSMIVKSKKRVDDYFHIDKESVRRFIDKEGAWVAVFMSGGVISLIEKWAEDGFEKTPDEICEIMIEALDGIEKSVKATPQN